MQAKVMFQKEINGQCIHCDFVIFHTGDEVRCFFGLHIFGPYSQLKQIVGAAVISVKLLRSEILDFYIKLNTLSIPSRLDTVHFKVTQSYRDYSAQ